MAGAGTITRSMKDSAIVVAVTTGLLYVCGSLDVRIAATKLGLPVEFIPDYPVEYYLFRGASNAIFLIFGLVASVCIILLLFPKPAKRARNWIKSELEKDPSAMWLLSISVAASVFVYVGVGLIAVNTLRGRSLHRVTTIRLSDDKVEEHRDLYLVSSRDKKYILIDRKHEPFMIRMVNEEAVRELVLVAPPAGYIEQLLQWRGVR
jgi:hypothetical protein